VPHHDQRQPDAGQDHHNSGEGALVDEVKAVEIRAELRQIKTMVDGSANIILNIGEDCREQVKTMIDWHKLMVRGVLVLEDGEDNDYGL
jgi:hypothetical protein